MNRNSLLFLLAHHTLLLSIHSHPHALHAPSGENHQLTWLLYQTLNYTLGLLYTVYPLGMTDVCIIMARG